MGNKNLKFENLSLPDIMKSLNTVYKAV